MSKKFNHADMLYQILPAIYREKDHRTKDLEKYLQACGLLLDQVQQTLRQNYADHFPDAADKMDEPSSQAWLLPYFARLLDVNLVSPSIRGRRDEVAKAIAWRKAKGTAAIAEEIAQAIGGYEVIVHEGWQRVAVTPRLNRPLVPESTYGYDGVVDSSIPPSAARHPSLEAVTIDFRCRAGAVATNENNPAAKYSSLDGKNYRWRQSSLQGAPCHPGKFDDPTRRTVDLRKPDPSRGHIHPRHLLLFRPMQRGFFHANLLGFNWKADLLSNESYTLFLEQVEIIENYPEENTLTVRAKNTKSTDGLGNVKIRQTVELGAGLANDNFTWRFEGISFENTLIIHRGRVELEQCAVRKIEVKSEDVESPVVSAKHSLFNEILVNKGLVRLEYCTVLTTTTSLFLQASGTLFNGLIMPVSVSTPVQETQGCLRFSSVHPLQIKAAGMHWFDHSVVRQLPRFVSSTYLQPGCGVLLGETSTALSQGAEDGSEMGAYHFLKLAQLDLAVKQKLKDFLPVGINAVIIPDASLDSLPGEI